MVLGLVLLFSSVNSLDSEQAQKKEEEKKNITNNLMCIFIGLTVLYSEIITNDLINQFILDHLHDYKLSG